MSVRHLAVAVALLTLAPVARADGPTGLTPDERARIDREVKELGERIDALRRTTERNPSFEAGRRYPDAEVFRKAVIWTLRYEPKLEPADVALIRKALKRCRERVA